MASCQHSFLMAGEGDRGAETADEGSPSEVEEKMEAGGMLGLVTAAAGT